MRTKTIPSLNITVRLTEDQRKKLIYAFSPSSVKYHHCPLCVEAEKKWRALSSEEKENRFPRLKCWMCPALFRLSSRGFLICFDLVTEILDQPNLKMDNLTNMRCSAVKRSKEEKKWARTLWLWLKEMEYEEDK